jgi:hypothetical protein
MPIWKNQRGKMRNLIFGLMCTISFNSFAAFTTSIHIGKGETKEFTVTIDPANNRLVASDNNGYHRPHGYGFSPGGMMMGYMLGPMMGRQGSFYSGAMSSARPNFSNTSMSPANYHQSAVSSVRSRSSASSMSSGARSRTGSKGFSFGK